MPDYVLYYVPSTGIYFVGYYESELATVQNRLPQFDPELSTSLQMEDLLNEMLGYYYPNGGYVLFDGATLRSGDVEQVISEDVWVQLMALYCHLEDVFENTTEPWPVEDMQELDQLEQELDELEEEEEWDSGFHEEDFGDY